MYQYIALFVLVLTCYEISGLDNGLARTPPMGWLQWERFRCITDCKTYPNQCVSEALFKRTADRLVSDGYAQAGYKYVNIDDCWPEHQRDVDGNFVADHERFPSGIKELADYIHGKGLKMGIYTDFGTLTCGGYPGSIFHMEKDTSIFAEWGIDMIKVDGCYACGNLYADGYKAFGWYMNHTQRPMLYSCSWPAYVSKDKPYKDIANLCNIWRNYGDIQDSWASVIDIINYNGDHQDEIVPFVGPGNFNDIDMLLIGDFSLSEEQSKTQFAIWSILAAPLFISADLNTMKQWQKDILLNSEVIAVNQDPLGKMGRRASKTNTQQTWIRPLKNNTFAVALMNTRTDIPVYMSTDFSTLNITGPFYVRDLYEHKDLGIFATSFKAMVNPSGVVMVKLTKTKKMLKKVTDYVKFDTEEFEVEF
ncbi:alpha-N-acetylgalactosaminidase-like [Hydractinia symbiolongicarpus]|uniref:alpha-N-acetylgalactosaminidase-like n=1 Tax=Hydractinia symbiolongicarpus TaxID=13093 RepID=UPI002550D6BB|nr:alpha-N-acetylgalactosaminidase-like [Hydractinia symbiolongicarpus]